jgi:putative transposase
VIVEFIAQRRDEHGVEPICEALKGTAAQIAPSTVRARLSPTRRPSARVVGDAELVPLIRKAHADNIGVYGARKIYAELVRNQVTVARCTVERLMRSEGLRGNPAGEVLPDHD